MDEEIELKDNKINVLTKELKDVNHCDEQNINYYLNKNAVYKYNKRERAKRHISDTLSFTYK
jgi:hypothetical protein